MTLARSSVVAVLAACALTACDRKPEPTAEEPPAVEIQAPPTPAGPKAGPQKYAGKASNYSRSYERCMASGDAAEGVTYAMQDCLIDEMKIEDERLNTTYQTVMKGLDDAGREKLRQAQRAWIVVRDSTCEANLTGGTIDRLNVPTCRLDATIARTKQLEDMLPVE